MRIPRLYCPALTEGNIEVPEQEAHHAGDVLRLRPGDRVVLFDGQGREASANIVSVARRGMSAEVRAIEVREFELPIRLTLAVAMPRTQRQGFLIEKCTELGVAEIWPMVTERAVAKPGNGVVEKLARRAIEAAKQAQRSFVPRVLPAMKIDEVVKRKGEFDCGIVCHHDPLSTGISPVLEALPRNASALACVGPEGGWSDPELANFVENGFRRVSLGPNVLRIETAAVAVCAACAISSRCSSLQQL